MVKKKKSLNLKQNVEETAGGRSFPRSRISATLIPFLPAFLKFPNMPHLPEFIVSFDNEV
jgi:hypothetical protein